MTTRFNGPIGAEPTIYEPKKPSADQIRSIGRAMPSGKHSLTGAQQATWFGKVVFFDEVLWDGEAFVSGDRRLTPEQIRAEN